MSIAMEVPSRRARQKVTVSHQRNNAEHGPYVDKSLDDDDEGEAGSATPAKEVVRSPAMTIPRAVSAITSYENNRPEKSGLLRKNAKTESP